MSNVGYKKLVKIAENMSKDLSWSGRIFFSRNMPKEAEKFEVSNLLDFVNYNDDKGRYNGSKVKIRNIGICGRNILIELEKMGCHTAEDYADFAAWCGCETFEEAQCNWGDISTPSINKIFKVDVSMVELFIKTMHLYCK